MKNKVYYSRVSAFNNGVIAEIFYKEHSEILNEDLEISCYSKVFSNPFLNAPKDKHYIRANKWIERQSKRMRKHLKCAVININELL